MDNLILELVKINEDLLSHAKTELALVPSEDEVYGGMIDSAVLGLIKALAGQGHSGGSAAITLSLFDKLSRFENLAPITDNPDEWNDVTEYGDPSKPMWQCKRNPALFSIDTGKTYYNVDKPKVVLQSQPWENK